MEGAQYAWPQPDIHQSGKLWLAFFLDIGRMTWAEYTKREDFQYITSQVEEIIRTQKFEGASADLLNANLIARELGLADKPELTRRRAVAVGPCGQCHSS